MSRRRLFFVGVALIIAAIVGGISLAIRSRPVTSRSNPQVQALLVEPTHIPPPSATPITPTELTPVTETPVTLTPVTETPAPTEDTLAPTDAPTPTASPGSGQTYTIQPGDTLGHIARHFGVSIEQLSFANGIVNEAYIVAGQELYIPGDSPGSADRPVRTYVVQAGDSLYSIARRFGTTINRLLELNNLSDPDRLKVGQELTIQSGDGGPVIVGPPDTGEIRYVVQPGDTLGAIALRFNTTIQQIVVLNGLTNPDVITAGINLLIRSGGGGPTSVTEEPTEEAPTVTPEFPTVTPIVEETLATSEPTEEPTLEATEEPTEESLDATPSPIVEVITPTSGIILVTPLGGGVTPTRVSGGGGSATAEPTEEVTAEPTEELTPEATEEATEVPTDEPTGTPAPPETIGIEVEWPTRMEIGQSRTIRVAMVRTSDEVFVATIEIEGNTAAAATPLPVGTPDTLLPAAFGADYTAYASARLVAASSTFEIVDVSTQEQSLDQQRITWEWNVTPRSSGPQVISAIIEAEWKPTIDGEAPIIREVWRDQLEIRVKQPLITTGQLSVASMVSGFLGSGLSIPWIYERTQDVIKKRRKPTGTVTKQEASSDAPDDDA